MSETSNEVNVYYLQKKALVLGVKKYNRWTRVLTTKVTPPGLPQTANNIGNPPQPHLYLAVSIPSVTTTM